MGYSKTKKLIQRDTVSGFHIPTDITEGEFGAEDLSSRLASQQEQINEAITADWSKPGDDSRSLGNAVSQLRKSIEHYGTDDNGGR